MTQDAESQQLLKQINEIFGSNILDLRNAVMAKTDKFYSRQAIYRWRVTGVPKDERVRRAVKKILREHQ